MCWKSLLPPHIKEIRSPKLLLLDYTNTDYWGIKLLRNDNKYIPIGTGSHPRIPESSLSLRYKNSVTDVRQTFGFYCQSHKNTL
jgi:hypothetical protein